MRGWRTILSVLSAFVVGAGSFWAATAVGPDDTATPPDNGSTQQTPAPPEMGRWLGLDRDRARRVRRTDPGFHDDMADLKSQLANERDTLASLLEDTESSDQAVLSQVEKVVEAQGRIERRVVDHLLKIRKHLSPDQRRKLFDLVARRVRRQGRGPGGPMAPGRNENGGRRRPPGGLRRPGLRNGDRLRGRGPARRPWRDDPVDSAAPED